jgi:putative ABC transport system permease protein
MFYELAQLALGNLKRARARLVMTAGGVVIGTTAVILLVALTLGLQRAAEAGIGSDASLTEIYVYANYGYSPDGTVPEVVPQLDAKSVQTFWRIPGVAAVIPMLNLQGGEILAGKYSGYGQFVGIDPALLPYIGLSAAQGDLSMGNGQIIVGSRVGENFYDPSGENSEPVSVDLFNTPLKLHLFQYSSQTPQERKISIQVSAVLDANSTFDYMILMPLRDVMRQNEWITGQQYDPQTFVFDQVIVNATSRETTNDVSDAIRKLGYGVSGMGDFLNQLNSFFTTMRLVLGGVGGVALLVAAFGIANTMTMAILERTKEIGVMKAVGATDRDVLTVFLIEAGSVGLAGGAVAVGLSLFLGNAINQAILNMPTSQNGINFLPVDPSQIGGNLMVIPPELSIFAVALATLVGLGAGLLPALRAARMPPVIALKQE